MIAIHPKKIERPLTEKLRKEFGKPLYCDSQSVLWRLWRAFFKFNYKLFAQKDSVIRSLLKTSSVNLVIGNLGLKPIVFFLFRWLKPTAMNLRSFNSCPKSTSANCNHNCQLSCQLNCWINNLNINFFVNSARSKAMLIFELFIQLSIRTLYQHYYPFYNWLQVGPLPGKIEQNRAGTYPTAGIAPAGTSLPFRFTAKYAISASGRLLAITNNGKAQHLSIDRPKK